MRLHTSRSQYVRCRSSVGLMLKQRVRCIDHVDWRTEFTHFMVSDEYAEMVI